MTEELVKIKKIIENLHVELQSTDPTWKSIKFNLEQAKLSRDRTLLKELADELEDLANLRSSLKEKLYNYLAEEKELENRNKQ